MENISSPQLKSNKFNEKNSIKLLLEASLNRKVEKFQIKLFDTDKINLNDIIAKNQTFKVWLYDKHILKDANSAINKNEFNPGKCLQNFPKSLKFKVGPIDYKLLKEQNREYMSGSNISLRKLETTGNQDKFSIVLALAIVGRPTTYLIEESIDIERISEHNLNSITNSHTLKGQPCVYFCRNNSIGSFSSNNPNNITQFGDHNYTTNQFDKIIYLAIINFTCDSEIVQCIMCNSEPKQYERFLYCHNDKKYFCPSCDDDYHVKTKHKLFQKHKRTVHMSFTMINQDLCQVHTLKPLEFYCMMCRAVYCIKCVTEGEHKNYLDHEVKYLSDVFASFDQEAKSLMERTRQFIYQVTTDLVENDKGSKESQKLAKDLSANAIERKQKLIEEVESDSLYRIRWLTSIASELHRIISEIDYKIYFLKNAYVNGDHGTYIAMTNAYAAYLKKFIFPQLEVLLSAEYKKASEPIIPEKEEEEKKRKPKIKFVESENKIF